MAPSQVELPWFRVSGGVVAFVSSRRAVAPAVLPPETVVVTTSGSSTSAVDIGYCHGRLLGYLDR